MNYCVIIRGPLGCGKTTIAKELSKLMGASYFSVDTILDENKLEEWDKGYISLQSFLKANDILSLKVFESEVPAVIDGNFYYKEQLEDLISKLDSKHYVFTLKTSLDVCIERDKKRTNSLGEDAVKAVFKKSNEFDYGTVIDVNKTLKECVDEIVSYI